MAGLVSSPKVPPGGAGRIEVTLDPIGKKGRIAKTVMIWSNDPIQRAQRLYVYATVRHGAVASATADLGKVLFSERCGECHAYPARGLSGRPLYEAVCAYCHGSDGGGTSAAPLKRRSDQYLRRWIADGRTGSGMPGYSRAAGGPLSSAQVDSLVAYVRRLTGSGRGG